MFLSVNLERNSFPQLQHTYTQILYHQYKLKIKLKKHRQQAKVWDDRKEKSGQQSCLLALIFSSHFSLPGQGAGICVVRDLFFEWRHSCESGALHFNFILFFPLRGTLLLEENKMLYVNESSICKSSFLVSPPIHS